MKDPLDRVAAECEANIKRIDALVEEYKQSKKAENTALDELVVFLKKNVHLFSEAD